MPLSQAAPAALRADSSFVQNQIAFPRTAHDKFVPRGRQARPTHRKTHATLPSICLAVRSLGPTRSCFSIIPFGEIRTKSHATPVILVFPCLFCSPDVLSFGSCAIIPQQSPRNANYPLEANDGAIRGNGKASHWRLG